MSIDPWSSPLLYSLLWSERWNNRMTGRGRSEYASTWHMQHVCWTWCRRLWHKQRQLTDLSCTILALVVASDGTEAELLCAVTGACFWGSFVNPINQPQHKTPFNHQHPNSPFICSRATIQKKLRSKTGQQPENLMIWHKRTTWFRDKQLIISYNDKNP